MGDIIYIHKFSISNVKPLPRQLASQKFLNNIYVVNQVARSNNIYNYQSVNFTDYTLVTHALRHNSVNIRIIHINIITLTLHHSINLSILHIHSSHLYYIIYSTFLSYTLIFTIIHRYTFIFLTLSLNHIQQLIRSRFQVSSMTCRRCRILSPRLRSLPFPGHPVLLED